MEQKRKGISIKNSNLIFSIAAIIIVIFMAIAAIVCFKAYQNFQNAEEIYVQCQEDAQTLKSASDVLTNNVRYFARTGNRKYMDDYFTEANVKKSREKAVNDLEKYYGNTEVFIELSDALNNSKELMNTEYYSMRLVCESFGITDMPDEVKSVQLDIQDLSLSNSEKLEKARNLVMDDDYQDYKDTIYQDVSSSLDSLLKITKTSQQQYSDSLNNSLKIFGILLMIQMAIIVSIVYGTRKYVVNPLVDITNKLLNQQPLPDTYATELSVMTDALTKTMQLQHERDEAVHSSKAKTIFMFNMSHDIRTPMNAIIGFTALARKHINQPKDLENCLEKIDTASSHMLDLVNDIVEMSQIESGEMKINESLCDIKEQLNTIIEMTEVQAKEKSLRLISEITIRDQYVYADSLNLKRILDNLISNALNFTKEGGTITVTAFQKYDVDDEKASFQFCVQDTGIGMTEEFSAKLFQSFEREQTSTESGNSGLGLGLSITKSLVDMMGGKISVKSHKGEGTTFFVDVSFRKVSQEDLEKNNLSQKTDSSEKVAGKSVLIVEDNDLNREIMLELMGEMGIKTDFAVNGKEAVNMISSSRPGQYDLIFMDIQMPVMNGYEATKIIRNLGNPALNSIPIVAISANSLETDRENSKESGMNGHLAKPIDPDEILNALIEYTC